MNYLLWLIYCLLQVCTFKHESYPLTSHAVVTTILLYVCFITSLTIFSSVAQSYLTLRPHGLQHTRPPCPSSTPRIYSNSCPLNWWCHPNISSSVVSFSSCLQSFPASRSSQMSQFFASRGQTIGVSASASVLPMNIQDCSKITADGDCSHEIKRRLLLGRKVMTNPR